MAKRTNIDIQNTIQKTKERATQVLQKSKQFLLH